MPAPMGADEPRRRLRLSESLPPKKDLIGHTVITWSELVTSYIEPAEAIGARRTNLDNAAGALLAMLDETPRLAVIGVPTAYLGDIRRLYAYAIEPAFRRNLDLVVQTSGSLPAADEALLDPNLRFAWTSERLRYLMALYERSTSTPGLPPLTPIEDQLLHALRGENLSPEAQYRIGRYQVDFAFPEVGLAVEADGRGWHDKVADQARDADLKGYGWTVLRFSGSRIYREAEECAREVKLELLRLPARLRVSDLEAPTRSPWQRLLDWLLRRRPVVAPPPAVETIEQPVDTLDQYQRAAANAHEGVVQVIAPAGSGKTTTIIARVKELVSRGTPRNRILVTTFNRAAADELRDRLSAEQLGQVETRSFHSLGRLILKEEGLLRKQHGQPSFAQWRRIARSVAEQEGREFIDAPEAAEAISNYKLADMISVDQARERASSPLERSAADIYAIYERQQEELDRFDFDDLILHAVRLLQESAEARVRWQGKWWSVLVDEYQDIEPAQQILVQILAAPEDSLFVVGDEDQCIYAWRRADVERIVTLDQEYPGLQRVVLSTTYRCPQAVADAGRNLIEHNQRRFPKDIQPAPGRPEGVASVSVADDLAEAASLVVSRLTLVEDPKQTVVLARTTRLLTPIVSACLAAGIPVRAPQRALQMTDSEESVLAYLQLLASPSEASPGDVALACRKPNWYLPRGGHQPIAQELSQGASFISSLAVLSGIEAWRHAKLTQWAELCDRLKEVEDPLSLLRTLRTEGGLDAYYSSAEQMSGADQVDIDALDWLEGEMAGMTRDQALTMLRTRKSQLESLTGSDDPAAIELSTIHGAKGREWETVILFGADDDQLPHRRAVAAAAEPSAQEAAIEDERRLAYVAITRASKRFEAVATSGKASRFLFEAGLTSGGGPPPTRSSSGPPEPTGKTGQSGLLQESGHQRIPAIPLRPSRSFAAKYIGTCRSCRRTIDIGQQITRSEAGYVHTTCE